MRGGDLYGRLGHRRLSRPPVVAYVRAGAEWMRGGDLYGRPGPPQIVSNRGVALGHSTPASVLMIFDTRIGSYLETFAPVL